VHRMAETDATVASFTAGDVWCGVDDVWCGVDDPKVTNGNSSDASEGDKKLANGDTAADNSAADNTAADNTAVGNTAADNTAADNTAADTPVLNGKTDNMEDTAGADGDESSNGQADKTDEQVQENGKLSSNVAQVQQGADCMEDSEDKSKENRNDEEGDARSEEKEATAGVISPDKMEPPQEDDAQSIKADEAPGTPKKKKKKKNLALEEDGTPKETRRSSRQRKPVSYVDDVKICPRAEEKGGSDVEMIDEKDPLSVDAESRKGLLKGARRDPQQQNVIVIDTNTLLRNQGNLAAAVAQQTTSSSLQHLNQQINNHSITLTQHPSTVQQVSAPPPQQTPQQMLQSAAQNVSSVGGNLNIGGINLSAAAIANNPAALQNAIAAITGGANAPPGLKNAYITAVQQVLLQQQTSANTTPAGQQYLANLHQYYNTLGALRDEAYVIEAPSFIVPYVMEGKPKESIKDFLKRHNKEQEDQHKKGQEQVQPKTGLKTTEKPDEKEGKADNKEKVDNEKADNKEKVDDKEKADDKEEKADDKEKQEEEKADDEEKEDQEEKDETKEQKKKVEENKEGEGKSAEKQGAEDMGDADQQEKEEKQEEEKEFSEAAQENKEKETEEKAEDDENKENKDDRQPEDNYEKFKRDDYTHLGRYFRVLQLLGSVPVQVCSGGVRCAVVGWEGFYKSSLGAFMLDLGLSQAQEFIQADLLKMQKRKLDKMKTQPSRQDIGAVKALDRQLCKSREKNAHLRLPTRTCPHCSYRTDSQMVMHRHLESPHMVNYTYKCNFCAFETRGPQVILFHMEAEHMVRGRLERAPAFFQCPLCPFEDNNKSKMTRHSFSCAKKFKPDKNCELLEWEPPAKIPKQISRGRTLPVNTNIKNIGGNLYDASGRSLMPKGLPAGLTMQQLQTAVAQGLLPNPAAPVNAANNLNRGRGRPVGSYKSPLSNSVGGVRPSVPGGAFGQRPPVTAALSQTQQLALAGQLFQVGGVRVLGGWWVGGVAVLGGWCGGVSLMESNKVIMLFCQGLQSNKAGSKGPGQTPSISITALPRAGGGSGGAAAGSTTPSGVKTATGKDGKPSFVICEICDGYIKDLEQLRNHMNFIHKVKIHPKMIYNRPPLNCQKCQHRFFTDQGLERHLLGTHGLVTSSMQEAANKSKDAGRCPICGKVFQWKLLNHVARDHKLTLKPAHLSYKCTVCTATFNMYRLFENHVYSAHSVVNKKDGGQGAPVPAPKTTNGEGVGR
ncbi:Zinc finger C2H2-type, partial [Trinorchestia longiramus]